MIYVFDTNSLSILKDYYPGQFVRFWADMNKAVESGTIVSVPEVKRELDVRFAKKKNKKNDHHWLKLWYDSHPVFFRRPGPEETLFVAEIFKVAHFESLVSTESRLKGSPVADPFVIAAAKVLDGCVVTEEKWKPKSAKIPNVCEHFGIQVITLEGFLSQMDWSYK